LGTLGLFSTKTSYNCVISSSGVNDVFETSAMGSDIVNILDMLCPSVVVNEKNTVRKAIAVKIL
jgi:hypothetical protein